MVKAAGIRELLRPPRSASRYGDPEQVDLSPTLRRAQRVLHCIPNHCFQAPRRRRLFFNAQTVMQIITGLRSVLSSGLFYDALQNLVGAKRNRKLVVDQYLRPRPHDIVLDIGCGTGDLLSVLPDVLYFGYDISPQYIDRARRRYGHRGTFVCGVLSEESLAHVPDVDLAIMHGVLHHLSNEEAVAALTLINARLRPGGTFVSVDPTFIDDQSRLARYIIGRDRGQNVRTPHGYRILLDKVFAHVQTDVRHDLNRIPYTHAVLRCTRGA